MDNKALQDYVATVNSGKYSDPAVLRSKFPEFENVDQSSLDDYVATANSGKYESAVDLNSKFPEFATAKVPVVKKTNTWDGYSFDNET